MDAFDPQRKLVDERLFPRPPTEIPVLIVGSGPSGLFAALLLAQSNISSVIIERHALRLGQPKAHAINPRSLEIFRQSSVDTARLRTLGAPVEDAFWVRFLTVLNGVEIGKLPYERQDEAVKDLTPEPLMNIPQPKLETFLQNLALDTGLVTLHRRWEWKSNAFNGAGQPISRVANRNRYGDEIEITSDYIIAADGTDSAVRKTISEIEWATLPGQTASRRDYVSIHVKGSIRNEMETLQRPAQLYFCMHPKHSTGIIAYDLSSSFVYARPVDPKLEPIGSFTEQRCRELINPVINMSVDYKIDSVNLWATDPRVASSFADSRLRVFLVGDAAHTFPPQGGLGINTGLADVHNLCWKLSYVISYKNHSFSEKLLSSYTTERRPVSIANALQSFVNEDRWEKLRTLVTEVMFGVSWDDNTVVEAAFQSPEITSKITAALELNRVHFDSLALQLGYSYGGCDGPALLENCSHFNPVGTPGSRLPHAWITAKTSTLDLLPRGKFSLFKRKDADLGGPLYVIGEVPVEVNIVNLESVAISQRWMELVQLNNEHVGLLVRPDGHILSHVSTMRDVLAALCDYLH